MDPYSLVMTRYYTILLLEYVPYNLKIPYCIMCMLPSTFTSYFTVCLINNLSRKLKTLIKKSCFELVQIIKIRVQFNGIIINYRISFSKIR